MRTRARSTLVFGVLAAFVAAPAARANVRLPHLISDGMVLQRERIAPIFGFADPGERVRVTPSWNGTRVEAIADASGRWSASVDTPAAGGPFTITIRGNNELVVRDVWIGEVWLASGQSNMEMPLARENDNYSGVLDWEKECASASFPGIRFFTVENALAAAPKDDCDGAWRACTPETVKHFSATAFFFARKLHADLGLPIGVIASDWGGTPAEAWISAETLKRLPEFAPPIERKLRDAADPKGAAERRAREAQAWRAEIAECDAGTREHAERPDVDDARWSEMQVPSTWSGALEKHDGFVWMRKKVDVPAAWAGKPLVLALGTIDDDDTTWWNGVQVGATRGWQDDRRYPIDAALVHAGANVIAVRVLDTGGLGGINGKKEQLRVALADGSASIPLAGAWRWKIGAELRALPKAPANAELTSWTPSALFDAMIAPLLRYAIRGAIWYQGESNRERAAQYKTLFQSLITDWRARFRQGEFPFYFVQIAPFGYGNDKGEAGELREAQRLALSVPNTGMVVTSDIGNASDIHPKNKQEVGRRLALWALAQTYGRSDVECSGPLLRSVTTQRGTDPGSESLELVFDHAQGLRLDSSSATRLFVAGPDKQFVPADVEVEGDKLRLSSAHVAHPKFARYAQGATDTAALFNAAGLPASPFRSDDAPWITASATPRAKQRWSQDGAVLALDAPIESWDEAVPLGNGLLGGLLWGGGTTLKLSLDRGDLWDLRTPAALQRPDWTWSTLQKLVLAHDEKAIHALFDDPYDQIPFPTKLPGGRIEIDVESPSPLLRFELDLQSALAKGLFSGAKVQAFFDAERPVAMMRIEGAAIAPPRIVAPNVSELPLVVRSATGDGRTFAQTTLHAADGSEYAIVVAWETADGATEIALTIATSAEDSEPAEIGLARAREALSVGFARLLGEHLVFWRTFQSASSVTLPDRALQTQYDLVRYLIGSGSRRSGPPMPLQGVWTRDGGLPPWKGDYHNDLNTQTTYLPYVTAGLFESGRSFLDFQWKLLPRFREFARNFYGVDGALVPGVMALDGSPLGGWSQYALSPTSGAWIAETFARHWRVTRDEEWLRDRGYPWCAEIGTALAQLLRERADGRLVLPLSSSPEIHDASLAAWLTPNSNYDLALLRSTFASLADMARTLKRGADAARWSALLGKLPQFDLDGRNALTFAKGEPVRESHRHFSQALVIHPLGLLSIEGSPAERAIVDATLDEILENGTQAWCGYSFAWFACMLARAGRPELALAYLQDYERAFTLRNGFHCNGDQSGEGLSGFTYRPFTLEGNMLAMEAVHEMLLQSWGGIVRVFPAVSARWRDVAFHDLRAEGGFKVSAERRDGVTQTVRVLATVPATLRLRDPFGDAHVEWNRAVRREGRDWVVDLAAGQELVGGIGPLPPSKGGH